MPEDLLPQHQALIESSAISPMVAAARGYRSPRTAAELRRLGFTASQARVPALLLPIRDVHEQIVLYQARPDEPRIVDGKAVKYETPGRSRMALDVPPSVRDRLGDPRVPLFITEGVRKADAAASIGLVCVAMLGVWNWRGTNEFGGKVALAAWESIALNDRPVHIVFDSDVMTNPQVHGALVRLRSFLESRGARVLLVYLPSGDGGAKVGLDDFLAAGHGVDDLLALAMSEPRVSPGEDRPAHPYRETPEGLWYDKPTANGSVATSLTNFRATIVAQIVEDDGAEQRRLFELEARLGTRQRRFRLPTSAFGTMNWATEHLGANAVTYAGMGTKDHARVAIQLLSGEPPERTLFTHTGWREVEGVWTYIHAGGAIGPDGADGTVTGRVGVRLDDGLAGFVLPDPPERDALVVDARASLDLLDLGPDRVTVPILAATYRAAVGGVDLGLHIAGPTGVFKSELAALAQQHFGPTMDARHLPASWESTDNALEGLAFLAKDVLLVVDDFAPKGSTIDVQRLHAKADRLFRGQGNRSGRGRMRADGSLRSARPPRGLICSSGEDVPKGQSVRARMLVLDLAPGDIDASRLSRCQRLAREGRYAGAMAGFVAWLAPRYGQLRGELPGRVAELREQAHRSRLHRRTPEIIANLAVGLESFLASAEAAGAIDVTQRAALWERCWRALGEAAAAQAGHQSAGDPASRFVELLAAAIASGRAHLAGREGDAPDSPIAWGWRAETIGSGGFEREGWHAQGARVGWLDGDDLYLDPDASFAAAQGIGRDTGDALTVLPRTLHQRLNQSGRLRSVDKPRERLTIRRSLEGQRRAVLHLDAGVLHGEPSQPSRPAQDQGPRAQDGPVSWDGPAADPAAPSQGTDLGTAHVSTDTTSPGPDGSVGTVTGRGDAGRADARATPDRDASSAQGAQQPIPWASPPAESDGSSADEWGTVG